VVATSGTSPAGGFFRPLPIPAQGTPGNDSGTGIFIPFHELLDDDAFLEGGRKRTLIDWVNYETQELIERDDSERRPHLPPLRNPLTEGVGGGAGAFGALPVMIPAPAPADLEDDEEAPSAPSSLGRRVRSGAIAAVVLGGLAAAGVAFVWNQRRFSEPPGTMASAAPERRAPVKAPVQTPIAADTMAAAAPSSTLASVPNPGEVTMGQPESTAVSGANAPKSAAASLPIAPTSDPKLMHFDSLADSLEQAARNFHDRSSDFTLGRITCDGLATGYRAADDAFIALAGTYRDVRGRLDDAREARYEALEQDAERVNAEFDRSKCPRP
jgi:hypothetical protein